MLVQSWNSYWISSDWVLGKSKWMESNFKSVPILRQFTHGAGSYRHELQAFIKPRCSEMKEISIVFKLPPTFMKCYNRMKKRLQLECILEFNMQSPRGSWIIPRQQRINFHHALCSEISTRRLTMLLAQDSRTPSWENCSANCTYLHCTLCDLVKLWRQNLDKELTTNLNFH